jgi:aspartate 4-decarboxylase
MDEKKQYQKSTMEIVQRRYRATVEGLGVDVKPPPHYAYYYGIVDLHAAIARHLGDDVVRFVEENYHPLDPVYRLAVDHAIVLLNGSGFDAPDWSLRISFANLQDDVYDDIGRAVLAVARAYAEAHRFAQAQGGEPRGNGEKRGKKPTR